MISNLPPNTYLMILVFMEIAMLIFSMLGQFSSGIYFIIIRIVFLVMAQCCKDPKSAAFYSVLAIMNAFYAFDPVGLFITGRNFIIICRWSKKNLICEYLLRDFMCFSLHSIIYWILLQISIIKIIFRRRKRCSWKRFQSCLFV